MSRSGFSIRTTNDKDNQELEPKGQDQNQGLDPHGQG